MSQFKKLDLSGIWQLAPVNRFGDPLDGPDFLKMAIPSHWQQHPDLERYSGKVLYRRSFSWKKERGCSVTLVIPGVFYRCSALLNGKRLGTHEGYFDPQEYDVTRILRPQNELLLEVDCPEEREKLGKRMITGVFSHWDCLDPTTNPGGVWLAPFLVESGFARIAENLVHTRRIDDRGAHQRMRLSIHSGRDAAVRLAVTFSPDNFKGKDHVFSREFSLKEGRNDVNIEGVIPEPRLWWTHDLGKQNLYRVTTRLETTRGRLLDEKCEVTGLRTVLVRDWIFHLNGRRLYIKGANLAPTDTRIATASEKTIRKDLKLARGAHLNLLRVHAHVGHPMLYRTADREGVLLWQDMPLIWIYRKDVLPEAVRQARAMVRLLYNHPSVAVWCGHNEPFHIADTKDENAGSLARTVFTALGYSWNRDIMDTEIKQAIGEEDPSRFVIRSSGEFPLGRRGTDIHFYGGWYRAMGAMRAFDRMLRLVPRSARFVGEFGAQSFPEPKNAVRFMDGDLGKVDWKKLEEKHGLQQALMGHWTPRAGFDDLAGYIRATQDYQSNLNRHYIDRLRALKYRPNGGCVPFMFHDPNPAVLWSVVDYWRTPKSSYFKLADAFRPVYAFALLPKDRYRPGKMIRFPVLAVNDTREPFENAEVKVVATDDEDREIFRRTYKAVLEPDCEAIKLGEAAIRCHIRGVVRIALTLTGCGDPFENVYRTTVD